MRKDKIMEKNHAEYMKSERDILTKIYHPFILQLRYSFQTKYRFYLVLDVVNGGHLFFQLYRRGLFREDLAQIYTAEIVSAVSHLHANGMMHRDLKPENPTRCRWPCIFSMHVMFALSTCVCVTHHMNMLLLNLCLI